MSPVTAARFTPLTSEEYEAMTRRIRLIHVICGPCEYRSRPYRVGRAAIAARDRHVLSTRHDRSTAGREFDLEKGGVLLEERFMPPRPARRS